MNAIAAVLLFSVVAANPQRPTLEGTVVDVGGKPIVGARIDIATAAPRLGRGLFCPSCYLDCRKWTTTNFEGRFTIERLDPDLKFCVFVSSPGKKAQITKLVDPLVDKPEIRLETRPTDFPSERTVQGVVMDTKNNPIACALVSPNGAQTNSQRWWGRNDAETVVTDRDGQFAIFLPEGYLGVDVEVTADSYSGLSTGLLNPGKPHRLVVPSGTNVTGRLVHFGQPMPGMQVAVVQSERSGMHHFIGAVPDVTDNEGRFSFSAVPADEPYVIFSNVGDGDAEFVLSTKRFRARGNGESRDLGDLEMVPALRLKGQLELPEGVTLPKDARMTLDRDLAWDLVTVPIQADGKFEMGGLPTETYKIRLAAPGVSLDPARLRYQQVGSDSFGLRLRESMDDLRIPVRAKDDK